MLNEISSLTSALDSSDLFRGGPSETPIWVNSNAYVRLSETFGILPFRDDTRRALGFAPYSPELAQGVQTKHRYLACQQDVLYSVLPIHTHEEHALFCLLVSQPGGAFGGRTEPNWLNLAVTWTNHSNGLNIFYKARI